MNTHGGFLKWGYPLVNKQFAIENGPVERSLIYPAIKWWIFPVRYVNVYQRVNLHFPSCSYDFPMVFPLKPSIFLWFSYGFSMTPKPTRGTHFGDFSMATSQPSRKTFTRSRGHEEVFLKQNPSIIHSLFIWLDMGVSPRCIQLRWSNLKWLNIGYIGVSTKMGAPQWLDGL